MPFSAIGVWAAILAAVVAISLVFGDHGAADGTNTGSPLGAAGAPDAAAINFTAPLAADPSASPSAGASAAPGTNDNDGGRKGPGGFIFGQGGPGPAHP